MHKFGKKLTFLMTISLISCSLFAAAPLHLKPLISATGGIMTTTQAGHSQTFPSIDSSTYTYVADHTQHLQSLLGGFAGAELHLSPNWAWQFGLAYYQSLSFSTTGKLTQGADAQSSDHYTYNYNIISRQVLLENKILFNCHQIFHPYAMVGLGQSFNQVSSFQNSASPLLSFSPKFKQRSNHAFSYTAGLGIDTDVYQNLRAGLAYRFASLGSANLGAGSIDTTPMNNIFKQSHLYTHEILGQLTYLF
jgi:opacity protein-like surface antigen